MLPSDIEPLHSFHDIHYADKGIALADTSSFHTPHNFPHQPGRLRDGGWNMQTSLIWAIGILSLCSIPFQELSVAAVDSTPPASPSGISIDGGSCPDFKTLPITPEKQRTSSWCWAAAGNIAMHYRGGTREQCFVVDAVRQNQIGIYSPSSCCIANPETTAGCGDVFDYAWATLDEFGFGYDSKGESAFGWPELRDQICKDGPIIYGEDYIIGGGHEYVIYGFIEDRTIGEKQVVLYDPSDDPSEYHEESYDSWLRMQSGSGEIRSNVQFLINIKQYP